jgi:lysophospholipid hydrolase
MEIHATGYAWRFIRKMELTPIKFVCLTPGSTFKGASMTLVGLLPPLCDNGKLLVDGGYSEFSRPSFPHKSNFLSRQSTC